jgi:hypothetical protein
MAFMNCTAIGGHAFSKDGSHWYVSPVAAYTPTVHYEDGVSSRLIDRQPALRLGLSAPPALHLHGDCHPGIRSYRELSQ